mmetsp:Transcript_23194/g.22691  ORF Transcript_23194/g.22691 Transcript_23194/m.22691 type:complete len:126 (-) Transcript_23194:12-389(-)
MNKVLQILKFQNTDGYPVSWSMYYAKSSLTLSSSTYQPVHLFPDSKQNSEFYILGAFDNQGGIMKPLRINGQIEWYALFTYLTVANSYALDRDSHIVGCGYYTASGDPSAGIFRIQNDGHLQWFL